MRDMKKGKLESGRSGKKVTNPKQAIAIGLSEARKSRSKVPAKKGAAKKGTKPPTKKGASKTASKKGATSK